MVQILIRFFLNTYNGLLDMFNYFSRISFFEYKQSFVENLLEIFDHSDEKLISFCSYLNMHLFFLDSFLMEIG